MKNFEDLTPLVRTGNAQSTATVTKVAEFLTHPILEGIADSFAITSNRSQVMAAPRSYQENPAQILLKANDANPVLAVRKFGSGKVVHFSFACSNATCFTNVELQKLYRNAVLWQSN